MISLVASDWPLTRKLATEGTLDVEWIETTSFLAESAVAHFPGCKLLLHNSLANWSLGHPNALDEQNVIAVTRELLSITCSPWLSVHLGFSAADVYFERWTLPTSPTIDRDTLFATICRNVQGLAAAIDVPLLLENLDYNSGGAYEHVCEPEYIRDVLQETGAELLLDIGHARVAAARLDIPIDTYLGRLPLDRVREVHISSPCPRDGVLADAHEPLREEDYALLEDVLGMTKPAALTLEYFREEAPLREQLGRLRAMLARRDS